MAYAELWLYWTSLPRLIISRTIWSEWTRSMWSPLARSRMSLERIVGTCNLPATLITLTLKIWNLTSAALGQLVWSNKAAEGSMVFQKATSEPTGKTKKPTAWHLMPHNKHTGKQGCNCQFRNNKIFNPHKHRVVTLQYLLMLSASVFNRYSLSVYLLLFVIFYLFPC